MGKKKLLILGHARHGKDTVSQFLNDMYGFTSQSSSVVAAQEFLFDALKDKYGYTTFDECFADRVNRRKEWYESICQYNTPDKARLAKVIMSKNDIYNGMRDNAELQSCLDQKVFDLVIGVYNPRQPLEPKESFDINIWQVCDVVIPNGGTLAELENRIRNLKPLLFQPVLNHAELELTR